IHVNESLLTELYDTLEPEYGTDVATFITALRLYGPVDDDSDDVFDETTTSSAGNPLTGVGTGTVVSSGDLTTDEAVERLATGVASIFGGGGETITRGGMDLSAGATYEIRSIYDLIDAEVEAVIDDQEVTLVSPWSSDPGELQATLPVLLDELTVTSSAVIKGRVNINQASAEVLAAIPGMPLDLPNAIMTSRSRRLTGGAAPEAFATSGWLLIEGLVDLPTMRALDGYITARGEVYRVQVLGHADRGGPVVRMEAVIDASEEIPRVRMMRNLSELGPGFQSSQLPTFGGTAGQ
ncbi:MAG: hypothetical protein KDA80_24560, partial [Planctomycetaceae bacterium]|nr:hypothetical protein [Planctomycetaceae bacterium]